MSVQTAPPPTLYQLWPKQEEACRLLGLLPGDGTLPVEEMLFGGQSGGGKSQLARAVGVTICLTWPGVRVPLFRRKYVELNDSHVPQIQQEIRPPIASFHAQSHELRFSNGSVLMFRHCENEQDVYNYLSAEWGGLLVDQAEQFTPNMLKFLRHRVRQPVEVRGWRPILLYSANPGGLSHDYLYDHFVAPRVQPDGVQTFMEGEGQLVPPGTVYRAPLLEGGLRRCYLPARLADNPSLDAEEYRRRLYGLPDHLRRAYLEGDWRFVPGAFFGEWASRTPEGEPWHVWSEAYARRHYEIAKGDPFPPKDWVHWAGVDGGFSDPWCVLWAARAPDKRVFIYREMYGAHVGIPQQADRMRAVEREHDEYVVEHRADPAMFTRRANLTVSDAQVYATRGVALVRGTNARTPGWRRVREHLTECLPDGLPKLIVLEGRCPNLVQTLPTLLADVVHGEDIAHSAGHKQNDHAADCLRYTIGPAAAPDIVRRPWRIETAPPMHRYEPADYRLGETGLQSVW